MPLTPHSSSFRRLRGGHAGPRDRDADLFAKPAPRRPTHWLANALGFLLLFFSVHDVPRGERNRFQRIVKVLERLRVAVALIFVSLLVGTVGYVVIEGYPWLDAYYMAIITLASVGFMEVHPLGPEGRIFTSLLILFNLGAFAYAISTITGIFAEGGFNQLLHDFRMDRTIEDLHDHTIVCGFGRHATELTQELSKQQLPFVVIDNNPDKMIVLREETTYLFVEGDATNDNVLQEAGVRRARTLVATLPNDADNLFIVLSARQMNPHLHIISRANNYADEVKIRRAGADHTVVPERIGGFYMATLVTKPDLMEFFSLLSSMGPSNVAFEEIMVSRLRSEFQRRSISESRLMDGTRVSLVAVRLPDGRYEFNPPPTEVLLPEHHVVLLGNPGQLEAFREKAMQPPPDQAPKVQIEG